MVKIQKGQWARYLKGEMPGLKVRQRIAAATGRSAEWILTGVDAHPHVLQPRRSARQVQDGEHLDPSLIAKVIGMALTHDEQQLCFPLCRALIHLLRRNDHTFAHLLEQTRWALQIEGDGDNDDLRELIRRFEKMKGYSVIPGKPAVSRNKSTRQH